MAFIETIVKISSDGKFNINQDTLSSILSKAKSCDNFALISIIGSKGTGKSFILNCFLKYLRCEQRDDWMDSTIEYGDYFCTDPNIKGPHIHMSYPLFLESDDQKTAVFLMDASNVFEDMTQLMDNKLMKDVIIFYLFISSTVIILEECPQQEVEKLRAINVDLEQLIKTLPSKMNYPELLYILKDWDPKYRFESGHNYLYGLLNGKKFINKERSLIGLDHLEDHFRKVQCFLMPRADINPKYFDVDLKLIGNDFKIQFFKFMRNSILDQDESTKKLIQGKVLNANAIFTVVNSFAIILNNEHNIDFEYLLTNLDFNQPLPPNGEEIDIPLQPLPSLPSLPTIDSSFIPTLPDPPTEEEIKEIETNFNDQDNLPPPPPVSEGIPFIKPTNQLDPIPKRSGTNDLINVPPPPPPPSNLFKSGTDTCQNETKQQDHFASNIQSENNKPNNIFEEIRMNKIILRKPNTTKSNEKSNDPLKSLINRIRQSREPDSEDENDTNVETGHSEDENNWD